MTEVVLQISGEKDSFKNGARKLIFHTGRKLIGFILLIKLKNQFAIG